MRDKSRAVSNGAEFGSLQKLWHLIPRTQRRQGPILLFLLTVGTAFEVLGVGLLVPLINLLTNENAMPSSSTFAPIFRIFGATTQIQMLAVGFASIGLVIFVKNIYLVGATHFQNWYLSRTRNAIETQMFERYLRIDYKFHLHTNSSTLSRNLISEVDQVIGGVLLPTFICAIEATSVIGVMSLLFYVEPVGSTALVVFFGVCGVGYAKVVSPVMNRFGSRRTALRSDLFRIIGETLGGIKQIKVLGRESFFLSRFSLNSERTVQLAARTDTIQRVPAYLIELWGVLGLLVVVYSMLLQGKEAAAVVSSLGLFVGASFRFVPSLNRLLIAWQTIRLARPAIDIVYSELRTTYELHGSKKPIEFKEKLRFQNLSFSYDPQSAPVLRDVTFEIRLGESLGIIGPSGAGKTTLVDLLLGLLSPTHGHIFVDDREVDPNRFSWQSLVGYVAQEIFLVDDTIRNNIAFGIGPDEISDVRVRKSIATAQLEEFIAGLPSGLDTVTGERGVRLSGGQRQRIGIARAMYHQPSLLILDEATSALDIDTEREFIETLEAIHHEITLIIVSHRMSALKYCDRIVRIQDGVSTVESAL